MLESAFSNIILREKNMRELWNGYPKRVPSVFNDIFTKKILILTMSGSQ